MANHKKQSSENNLTKAGDEKRTSLDKFKEQKFVDDIPMEDLKLEKQEEKEGKKSKSDSQSERKYKTD